MVDMTNNVEKVSISTDKHLNKQIDSWIEKVRRFLKKKKLDTNPELKKLDDLVKELDNLLNKVESEERKEIKEYLKEIERILNTNYKDIVFSYGDRSYIDFSVKLPVSQREKLKKGNVRDFVVSYLGLKKKIVREFVQRDGIYGSVPDIVEKEVYPFDLLNFSQKTVESFFKNYSRIKRVINEMLKGRTLKDLSSEEKDELENKLEKVGYIPDGGGWDFWGYSELETVIKAVNYLDKHVSANKLKSLEDVLRGYDKIESFSSEISKIDFKHSVGDYLHIKPNIIKERVIDNDTGAYGVLEGEKYIEKQIYPIPVLNYSKVTVESFLRNYSEISKLLKGVNYEDLTIDEIRDLQKKLEKVGYIPDKGWGFYDAYSGDYYDDGELKSLIESVNYINSNPELLKRIKSLQYLMMWGITSVEVARSKFIAENYLNKSNLWDFIGDYDGNGELSKDDKGIYTGHQIAEIFKRLEAIDSNTLYIRIKQILDNYSDVFGWGDDLLTGFNKKGDLVNFFKKYPEAKYVLVKEYELLPVENLLLGGDQIDKYLKEEKEVITKAPGLKKVVTLLEQGLIEKYKLQLTKLKNQIKQAMLKCKDEKDKGQLQILLNNLDNLKYNRDIINAFKPSIFSIIFSLVEGNKGINLLSTWSSQPDNKKVQEIIDSFNFSLGVFRLDNGYIPGIILSIDKDIPLDKENHLVLTAGTAMWMVNFVDIKLKHIYGFKEINNRSLFDFNKSLKSIAVGVGLSNVGWKIEISSDNDRLAAAKENIKKFETVLNDVIKLFKKGKVDSSELPKLAKKYNISLDDINIIVSTIKKVIDLPAYSDTDKNILLALIKDNLVNRFIESQYTYITVYRNNEISGFRFGILFLAGFLPLPYIMPNIRHYYKVYSSDKVDYIRDYLYTLYAQKNAENLCLCSRQELVDKLNGYFRCLVRAEETEKGTILIKPLVNKPVWKSINVFINKDKLDQIKVYDDGSIEIGNIGDLHASFLTTGKTISFYLFLGGKNIDNSYRLTDDLAYSLRDNNPTEMKFIGNVGFGAEAVKNDVNIQKTDISIGSAVGYKNSSGKETNNSQNNNNENSSPSGSTNTTGGGGSGSGLGGNDGSGEGNF